MRKAWRRVTRVARIQAKRLAQRSVELLPERDRQASYLGTPFSFPSRSLIGRTVARGEVWDLPLRSVASELPLGGVVVDVGANLGASSLTLAAHRPDLRFLCLEPSDRFFPYLERNLAPLVAEGRATLRKDFVGPPDAGVVLHQGTTSASAVHVARRDVRHVLNEPVAPCPLDVLSENVSPVVLIKVDTDGYEVHVIESGRHVIAEARPHLFLEWTPRLLTEAGRSEDELRDLLKGLGYVEATVFAPNGALLASRLPLTEVRAEPDSYVDVWIHGSGQPAVSEESG
jgi:FkbM family methyltransferase